MSDRSAVSKLVKGYPTVGNTVPIRYPWYPWLYTLVNFYEYLAPTVPWYELDSNVARVCTIYTIKKGLSRFEHDFFIKLFIKQFQVRLVRFCTIKHDFCSIYSTFTGFTYGPADLCSSYARIYLFVYVWYKWIFMAWIFKYSNFDHNNNNFLVMVIIKHKVNETHEI